MTNTESIQYFTAERLQELRSSFKECDKNADGRLTTQELVAFIMDLEGKISRDGAENAIKDFDKDKDHALNFEEVCSLLEKKGL